MDNKQITIKCPCCNNLITMTIDNPDKVEAHSIFYDDILEELVNMGYEFGVNGGD